MCILSWVRSKDFGFWQYEARSAWDHEARKQTVLLVCPEDNLVGCKMVIIKKVGNHSI